MHELDLSRVCIKRDSKPQVDIMNSIAYEPEMGWMPLSPDGIAMCHTCGVETQVEREGIHGRS